MLYIVQFNYWIEQPHEDIYDENGDVIDHGAPLTAWFRRIYSKKSDADYFADSERSFLVEIVETPKTKKEWIKFISSRTWEYCEITDRIINSGQKEQEFCQNCRCERFGMSRFHSTTTPNTGKRCSCCPTPSVWSVDGNPNKIN